MIEAISKLIEKHDELRGGTWSGGVYRFPCKCHADKKASAFLCAGDKPNKDGSIKIMLYCHACGTIKDNPDMLTAHGLTLEELNGARADTTEAIKRMFLRQFPAGSELSDVYDYKDENDCYLYSKLRFITPDGKQIRYARIDHVTGEVVAGRGSIPPTIYKLPRMLWGIKNNMPVYIVEGEKDAETLTKLKYIAVTFGSCRDFRDEFTRYFKGASVVIIPDNDKPGKEGARKICYKLRNVCYKYKVVDVSALEHGDVTDYLTKEDGTPEGLKEKIDAVPWSFGAYVTTKSKTTEDKDGNKTTRETPAGINADLIAEAIEKHDYYFIVRAINDREPDTVYMYKNGVYTPATRNEFISEIIRPFLPRGMGKPQTLKNVYDLILQSVEHVRTLDELDRNTNIINTLNGLVDIVTGEIKPHTPAELTTRQLQVVTDPDGATKPAPYFYKYLSDLCKDESGKVDKEKAKVLQEFSGLLLSNIPCSRVKKAFFLQSDEGNTGKSQMLIILQNMLGNALYKSMDLQKLDASKESNRFSLGTITNQRAIISGDNSAVTIKDPGTFKALTGGDTVEMEGKHRDGRNLSFSGGIIAACNKVPYFENDQGKHIKERLLIFPCMHVIPEDERNPNITSEIIHNELPQVFAFALQGLQRLVKNNYHFTESEAMAEALNEYKKKSDIIYKFIAENYHVTNDNKDRVRKSDFENSFKLWAETNEETPIKKKNIAQRMASNGHKCGKISGYYYYFGLTEKLLNETATEEPAEINDINELDNKKKILDLSKYKEG